MAEIKSTLDLVMEKTKKLEMTAEEKEELKRKEVFQKAMGLFHRYLDGTIPLNEIVREIEKLGSPSGATVKDILVSQWIEALSLGGDNEKLLKGIKLLKDRDIEEANQKFLIVQDQYRSQKEMVRQEVSLQLIETLRKKGIRGTAVVPNVEGNPDWKGRLERLNEIYRKQMEEVKESLRRL